MNCVTKRIILECLGRAYEFWNISSSYRYHSHHRKYTREMPLPSVAHFRILNDKEFNLTFTLFVEKWKENRLMSFQRCLQEPVGTFIQRVFMKVNTHGKKNKKKGNPSETEGDSKCELPVLLMKDDVSIPGDTICEDLFHEDESENLALKIGDICYSIFINHPWINYVALPKVIMAGFPIYPFKMEILYSDEVESEFLWFRKENNISEPLASKYIYIPSVQDIGRRLELKCTPKRKNITGQSVTATSEVVVDAGPGQCPFDVRHLFTKDSLSGDSFRVVSYNILADLYASSQTGKTEIFFYCPPYALTADYRKLLLLKELLGYNADIVCLQEVDCKLFQRDLQPVLRTANMEGVMTKKGGQVNEGVACFYNKSRFKLISDHSLVMGENLPNRSCLKNIWDAVSLNETLKTTVTDKTTAVQILVFDYVEKPNHKLIVANTHLYFHPEADHVRLLQAGMCLNLANDVKDTIEKQEPDCTVSIIFAGDFNSTPECGVFQLFTKNVVPEDYHEWKSDVLVDESVSGLSLRNPTTFKSACGTPDYTNFTANFLGCLDYIFYECDSFQVEQVIPFPSREDVNQFVAIPSIVFPSDHIALVSDLKWK